MKLADWRKEQGWTQQQLATALECTISSVARYENGTRDPEPAMKERIFLLTEGQVEPNDFYPVARWRRAVAAIVEATLSRAA
jgi:transcriptional regulator with XRE-family HTH domain